MIAHMCVCVTEISWTDLLFRLSFFSRSYLGLRQRPRKILRFTSADLYFIYIISRALHPSRYVIYIIYTLTAGALARACEIVLKYF